MKVCALILSLSTIIEIASSRNPAENGKCNKHSMRKYMKIYFSFIFSGSAWISGEGFLLAGGRPGRQNTLIFPKKKYNGPQENWVVTNPLGLKYQSK